MPGKQQIRDHRNKGIIMTLQEQIKKELMWLRRRPKLPRFVLIKKGTTWCAGVFHREGLRLAVGMRDWWERRWVY